MELFNCKNCGTPFLKRDNIEVCFNCLKQEMDTVKKIREFAENVKIGYLSLNSISEHTGIELSYVEKLYKKGLLLSINDKLEVKCQFCNEELRGKDNKIAVCPKCSKNLVSRINVEKSLILKDSNYPSNTKKSTPVKKDEDKSSRKYGFKKNYD